MAKLDYEHPQPNREYKPRTQAPVVKSPWSYEQTKAMDLIMGYRGSSKWMLQLRKRAVRNPNWKPSKTQAYKVVNYFSQT